MVAVRSRPLKTVGWCALIAMSMLLSYIGLGMATGFIVGEPILGSVILGAVVAVGVLVIRLVKPEWLSFQPTAEPNAGGVGRMTFWAQVSGIGVFAFLLGQTTGTWFLINRGSPAFEAQTAQRADAGVIVLILTFVIAPVSEELFFRGALYPLLRRKVGITAAVITSSMAFCLLHANIVQIASVLPLAVLTALLYERTRRVLPVIGAHLLFNIAAALVPPIWMVSLANPVLILCLGLAFGLSLASVLGNREPGADVLRQRPPTG